MVCLGCHDSHRPLLTLFPPSLPQADSSSESEEEEGGSEDEDEADPLSAEDDVASEEEEEEEPMLEQELTRDGEVGIRHME